MAEATWETPLKNAALTLLGGLVEPSSELAQPMVPYSAESAVLNSKQSNSGYNNDGSPIIQPAEQNKTFLYAAIGVGVLLVLVLLMVALRGGK